MNTFPQLSEKLLSNALNFLFPISCVCCKKKGYYLCADCLNKIPLLESYIFSTTTLPNLTAETLSGVIPAAHYTNLKTAIYAFKYSRIKSLAAPFGNLMRRRLKKFLADNPGEWSVIPLPLHRRKKCSRGFNQNDLLSAECFKEYADPLSITLCLGKNNPLQRVKDTKSQTNLNGTQRIENVKKCFCVKDLESVKNKRILLIDDIITTGATLKEAADTLFYAGAKLVWGCVLAQD